MANDPDNELFFILRQFFSAVEVKINVMLTKMSLRVRVMVIIIIIIITTSSSALLSC